MALILVDTGAKLSFPPSPEIANAATPALHTLNNTVIASYGLRSMTIDMGLGHRLRWVLVVADVSFAILGVDFVSHFDLDVSVPDRCLKDNIAV